MSRPTPPEERPAREAPPGFVEPSLARRFFGAVIDSLVVTPLSLAPSALLRGRPASAVALALVSVYSVVLVARTGRTVGKHLVRTRVVDAVTGAVPTLEQAARRWLTVVAVAALALALPVLGWLDLPWTLAVFLPVLSGPLHRGLHDRAAGTVVTGERPDDAR